MKKILLGALVFMALFITSCSKKNPTNYWTINNTTYSVVQSSWSGNTLTLTSTNPAGVLTVNFGSHGEPTVSEPFAIVSPAHLTPSSAYLIFSSGNTSYTSTGASGNAAATLSSSGWLSIGFPNVNMAGSNGTTTLTGNVSEIQ